LRENLAICFAVFSPVEVGDQVPTVRKGDEVLGVERADVVALADEVEVPDHLR
jgi:hypothetical protein